MKNLIGVIILAALCVGLGVILFTSKKQAEEEKRAATTTILNLSNDVVKTAADLTEQVQVNTLLSNDLTKSRAEFGKLTEQSGDPAWGLIYNICASATSDLLEQSLPALLVWQET